MWSKEKPTKAGWYWWKGDEGVCIVQVSHFNRQPMMAFFVTGRRELLTSLRGEWQPVQGPQD